MKNLPSMGETDPYPAGGAVAAQVAELAASLAAAAADHSRDGWPEAGGARAQAQALGRRAAALGEQGAGRFLLARRALAERGVGTAATGETQAERDWRLRVAVEQAAEPPLELAACAADIAELAGLIATRAAAEVRVDAVIAAMLAAAAARAAGRLVQINLVVGDRQPAAAARGYAAAAAAAADAAEAAEP